MLYIHEPYYFRKNRINFPHAFRVTTLAVGRWCDWYEAIFIIPKKGVKDEEKKGKLSENFEERNKFLDSLIEWLINNSENETEVRLIMNPNPIPTEPVFAYYDSGQWNLSLTTEEYKKMQQVWLENNLPEDLFYPLDKALRLLKPLGLFGKFMTSWGWTWESFELYSPKDWEEELKKNPDAIKKLPRHVPL